MRKLIASICIAATMLTWSCGDPSENAGEDAATQQNNDQGTGDGMHERNGYNNRSTSGSNPIAPDTTEKNKHEPIQGSGSAPAD